MMPIDMVRQTLKRLALAALFSLITIPASSQILINPNSVGGQISLFAGQANQVFEVMISGAGELVGGANFRIQIGETGQDAPAIQVLDLVGSSSNPTFWTGNNEGQSITFASNRQSAEGSITTTDSPSSISAPNDPVTFARVTLDATDFAVGQSFQIYFENILSNNLLDTQILDPSGNPLSTSFGSATVNFTAVPEPEEGVFVAALGMLFWSCYTRWIKPAKRAC